MGMYKDYNEFIKDVKSGLVKTVTFAPKKNKDRIGYLIVENHNEFIYIVNLITELDIETLELFSSFNIDFKCRVSFFDRIKNHLTYSIKRVFFYLFLIGLSWIVIKNVFYFCAMDSISAINFNVKKELDISKSKFQIVKKSEEIDWDDLILPKRLMDNIKFFAYIEENKDKCKVFGAKPKKGLIFYGEPGTGKTHTARILASKLNRNFISISGSDLENDKYIGTGAKKIRELFDLARENAPCTIFIDEIDAIGLDRRRRKGYYNQSINELLVQLDGVKELHEDINVIASTNKLELLDPALIRPGRFDSQLYFPKPEKEELIKLIKLYIKKRNLSYKNIDIEKLSNVFSECTGADIKNIINESILEHYKIYQNHNLTSLSTKDLLQGYFKFRLNSKKAEEKDDEEHMLPVAYHEAGHCLVDWILKEGKEKNYPNLGRYLTIVPGDRFLGVFIPTFNPSEWDFNKDKECFRDNICISFAGRYGEERFYNTQKNNAFNFGASADLSSVLEMSIKEATFEFLLNYNNFPELIYTKLYELHKFYPKDKVELINNKVNSIIEAEKERTKNIIELNKETHEKLAKELYKKKTMYYEDLAEFFSDKKLYKC